MYIWNCQPTSVVFNDNNTPLLYILFSYNNGECKCPNCTSIRCPNSEGSGLGKLRVYRDFRGAISFTLDLESTENIYVHLDSESRDRISEYVGEQFVVKPVLFVFDEPVYVPAVKNGFMETTGHHTINVAFVNHTEYSGATIYIRDGRPDGAFDVQRIYPHHLSAYLPMFNDRDVMRDMWKCYAEGVNQA